MMPYLESGAHLCHHIIVQIKPIVGYDSLRKPISTYDFSLDETGYHRLRYTSIRRCFYPLGKVVNDYKNENQNKIARTKWGVYRCLILNRVHTSVTISLFKLSPLSDMILFGSPYRHMISLFMNRATIDFVTLAYDVASTHLVK